MPLITDPSQEPVTLAETKEWCDIEHNDDDTLISTLISASRRQVEVRTQSSLVRQLRRLYIDRFPESTGTPYGYPYTDHSGIKDYVWLPYGPVQNIYQIQYIDENGTTQTISSSPLPYTLDHEDKLRLAYNQTWPSVRNQKNAIWIDYWAGYFDPAESPLDLTAKIPEDLKCAIMLMVRDLYDNPARQHAVDLYQNRSFDLMIDPYRHYVVA